jgi:dTDP-4-dehydrorhamnose 3,5-epimerase-like enzyme
MSDGFTIHDLYSRPVSLRTDERGEHWTLLRFEDHLLRRFGLAELIRSDPAAPSELRMRPVADEIWILLEGQAEFAWHDLRPGSPTLARTDRLTCSEPTLVLVPFGVAFGYRPIDGRATFLRLATHAETTDEGARTLPWETA